MKNKIAENLRAENKITYNLILLFGFSKKDLKSVLSSILDAFDRTALFPFFLTN